MSIIAKGRDKAIPEGLAELEALYGDKTNGLVWPCVFSLPDWMSAWWRQFGWDFEPGIFIIRDGGQLLGVAPFKCRGGVASFIGDAAVCDYMDFIVIPGQEEAFSEALLKTCAMQGINRLELGTLRPDSVAMRCVLPWARSHGFDVDVCDADVSYEISLPTSYELYLEGLTPQQRREIWRKQRRLGALGKDNFRMLKGSEINDGEIEAFLGLMAESRCDKADFLTKEMRNYFKDMASAMALCGLLRLGFLDIGKKTVAGVLGFDYNNVFYLYNSGYDPAYAEIGVGLLSKLAAVRWAIENQKLVFDFLKGPEVYKERLGGRRIALMNGHLATGS